jgi:tetratricopeptide (TPR) repeat protein
LSTSYHQLGMLAQDRGDYDTAETLYRQSLEIRERLGNQAGVATTYSVLAGLSEALGNLDQAVAYLADALAIRLKLGTATAGQVQQFAALRRTLGDDRFHSAATAAGFDEESVVTLEGIISQYEDRADE